MRLIGWESLPWATTWTGEFTVELFVGVQMVTDGVGAELTSHAEGPGTETVMVLLNNTPSESRPFPRRVCVPDARVTLVSNWFVLVSSCFAPSTKSCIRPMKPSVTLPCRATRIGDVLVADVGAQNVTE